MRRHQYIDDPYAQYLLYLIGSGVPDQAKHGLQEVCRLYARGFHVPPSLCVQVEIATVGQLITGMSDAKIRRWSLNVIALIGTADRSKATVETVIGRFHNDPDTMASALTAFFRVCPLAYASLREKSYIRPEQIALAAYTSGFWRRIRNDETTINIEVEDAAILRSALVTVGLGKAPPNLFHPKYSNEELVGRLCQHDDELVMQYSVWAIAEHPDLDVRHLDMDLRDLRQYPDNVRGWVYRLFGATSQASMKRHDLIAEGSQDAVDEARLNLAKGLRDSFYDGLEVVTCEWFHDEQHEEVRGAITDHFVGQSEYCPAYEDIVKRLFLDCPKGSIQHRRMLAAASRKPIFRELRKIEYQADGDLFGDMPLQPNGGLMPMVNNTYNIGNVQGGAVSIGGAAKQEGPNANTLTGDQTVQLKTQLENLAGELQALTNPSDNIRDIAKLVEEAAKDPVPNKLNRLNGALTSLLNGASDIAKFGGDATKIIGAAEKIMGLLG